MSWVKLVYSDHIKPHYIHKDLVQWCVEDILARYGQLPTTEESVNLAWVDPGGAMMVDSPRLQLDVEDFTLHVKAEHMPYLAYRWGHQSEKTTQIVKVYFDGFNPFCLLLPKELYEKAKLGIIELLQCGEEWKDEFARRISKISPAESIQLFPEIKGEN